MPGRSCVAFVLLMFSANPDAGLDRSLSQVLSIGNSCKRPVDLHTAARGMTRGTLGPVALPARTNSITARIPAGQSSPFSGRGSDLRDVGFETVEGHLSIWADLDQVSVGITHVATPFPAAIVQRLGKEERSFVAPLFVAGPDVDERRAG